VVVGCEKITGKRGLCHGTTFLEVDCDRALGRGQENAKSIKRQRCFCAGAKSRLKGDCSAKVRQSL